MELKDCRKDAGVNFPSWIDIVARYHPNFLSINNEVLIEGYLENKSVFDILKSTRKKKSKQLQLV